MKRWRRYRFEWLPFIFSALFLCVLLNLGCWQLRRYDFKQHLVQTRAEGKLARVLTVEQLANAKALQFRELRVKGHYLNKLSVLLQNKFSGKRPGYNVLTAFKIEGQSRLLLVNRGWIPLNRYQQKPQIQSFAKSLELTGHIKELNERAFILGQNVLSPASWPLLVQRIDIQELEALTKQQFYPFVLRLNPDQASGFVRDWPTVTMKPEKHLGYALQWFTMALALMIAYYYFATRKTDEEDRDEV